MSQESDKEPELKVIDKRRFSSDGDSQNSGTVEEPRRFADVSPASSLGGGPTPQASGSVQLSGNAKKAELQPVQSEPNPATPLSESMSPDEGEGTRVEFASFLMSLATQTLMMLGEIPNPETRLTSMNLGAARQTIDILDMLELKTKGNLSAEESQLFKELLPSLKMAFVEKVRGAK